MKKLISIGEAAKRLGVSIDTLRRWDKKGILKSVRASGAGYRYYLEHDLYLFINDLFVRAEEWVEKETGVEPVSFLYCPTRDIFDARWVKMENELAKIPSLPVHFSLITAVIGEIGNNSFDHNLGNWRDIPGIFFGYDIEKKYIVLADRGQGILKTLQHVKPELEKDAEAVKTAFTEVISGRAPEARGNGLKYVKEVVTNYPLTLLFETGDAQLTLAQGDQKLNISEKIPYIAGCLAVLQF